MLTSPIKALATGLVVTVLVLLALFSRQMLDGTAFAHFAVRAMHIVAAALWVGLIWFVNFIQLPLIAAASDADRGALVRLVVPRVARTFHGAAHLTIATGAVMLVGVLRSGGLDASPRALALWLAIAGGLAMWAVVQFGIAPRIKLLGDAAATPQAKSSAANTIRVLARINLVLALPVTVLMIAVAHFH